MSLPLRHRALYEKLSRMKDSDFSFFDAAVLVAQEEFPDVSIEAARSQIAEIAAHVRPRLSGSLEQRYATLGEVLFNDLGFSGNRDDYYDPLNSYLPQVLERKTGIPITMALVIIEVARELGLSAVGVAFPGHYLVRHDGAEEVILDPFTGEVVTRDDLVRRMAEPGVTAQSITPLLKKSGNRAALVRLVSNLKHAYMLRNEYDRALRSCEIALLLDPAHAASYRDRGLVCEKLELFHRAEKDLTTYLELSPNDKYAPAVAEHLMVLRNRVSMFH